MLSEISGLTLRKFTKAGKLGSMARRMRSRNIRAICAVPHQNRKFSPHGNATGEL
ncbi:hypothetical protein NDI37_09350 [Funiculus sociatus GB2-A5]|uniref:Uncharacterized protein n=1 Tax=Funiculus sociatus GB2-A5 TaxID=2933946 RepID=A0ABV0JML4_9CYAN|nr:MULTISPECIES: hypothetical protein [unclassified Trichocoleus]MBD1905822.1 hypothetical protein [Trichocoleus sp. FACHB-832]MBD2065381.1 hypothetical protein [Trichocoleus sp. FACHB-6]